MRRRIFHSLNFKLGATVVLIVSAVLAVLGQYYVQRFSEEVDRKIVERLQLPGVLMNRQLLRYESVADPEVMTELVGEEFVDGLVVGSAGLVFYSLDPSRVGRSLSELPHLRHLQIAEPETGPRIQRLVEGGEVYLTSLTPLTAYEGATPFFFCYVKIRTTVSEGLKQAIARRFLVGSGFGVACISIFILWFVRRLITCPLRQLEEGADRLAQGDLGQEVTLRRNDELGSLARSFTQMRDAIRSQISRLEEFNRTLEDAVRERTRDLAESNRRFDAFMRHSPSLAFIKDRDGRYLFLSAACGEIYGQEAEKRLGRTDADLWPLELAERQRRRDARVLEENRAEGETETVIVDGEERHHLVVRFPIAEVERQTLLGGIVTDITERVLAEREKADLESRLHQARKMEVVGTLAGGVAHDLNNILSALVGYPDLLLIQLPGDSPLREPIQTIQRAGERAAAIVQDLLTLARRGVQKREPVALNRVIGDYLESPEHESIRNHHPGVRFDVELGDGLLPLEGSPAHLGKTVMNLISNAAESMPSGGRVRVTTSNRYVDRPLAGYDSIEEGEYVVLEVSDTGTGIAAADLERIFEPFYTKKTMGRSGTGLGLAVVWGTVKDHRGYVNVCSEEGKGTTFCLYFRALRGVGEVSVKVDGGPVPRGDGERVLVVDDVAEQREIASAMLTGLGYRVEVASSGDAAVMVCLERPPDLLLLDMIMPPGIDGCETYRRICRLRPGQAAVLASGFSQTERVLEAQRLGAGPYLSKPYGIRQLGEAVHDALAGLSA